MGEGNIGLVSRVNFCCFWRQHKKRFLCILLEIQNCQYSIHQGQKTFPKPETRFSKMIEEIGCFCVICSKKCGAKVIQNSLHLVFSSICIYYVRATHDRSCASFCARHTWSSLSSINHGYPLMYLSGNLSNPLPPQMSSCFMDTPKIYRREQNFTHPICKALQWLPW